MNLSLKIGSRGSPLALVQVEEVLSALKEHGVLVQPTLLRFTTKGDLDKKTSLTLNPADDFFTDALDQALLKGEIDIAIAVRGDAIEGEPVVDTQHSVMLKIQSAFEFADGINTLIVDEELQ